MYNRYVCLLLGAGREGGRGGMGGESLGADRVPSRTMYTMLSFCSVYNKTTFTGVNSLSTESLGALVLPPHHGDG